MASAETLQTPSQPGRIRRVTSAILSLANLGRGKEKIDPATAITAAASKVGLGLEPERLAYLVRQANKGEVTYSGNTLLVEEPVVRNDQMVAKIDLTPWGTHAGEADPTKTLFWGLTETQNYALLVDTGYRPKPDMLSNPTNPRMANAAKRFGFKEGEVPGVMEASFDTVHDAVFSTHSLALTEKLYRHYGKEAPPPIPPAAG